MSKSNVIVEGGNNHVGQNIKVDGDRLEIGEGAVIRHLSASGHAAEHQDISLPPGAATVSQKRQADGESWSTVED